MLIRGVGMACCYRQATRFAPPRGIVRLAQAVKCSDLVLGNCENKLCSFFLGDSRPGAFVVADMCVNLLVELAFGAVLSPEMG